MEDIQITFNPSDSIRHYGRIIALAIEQVPHIVKMDYEYQDDYQGEVVFVFTDDKGLIATATTGFGSCSGCDWLEGLWDDGLSQRELLLVVAEWAGGLLSNLEFSTVEEWLANWKRQKAEGTRWYWYDDEIEAIMFKLLGLPEPERREETQ